LESVLGESPRGFESPILRQRKPLQHCGAGPCGTASYRSMCTSMFAEARRLAPPGNVDVPDKARETQSFLVRLHPFAHQHAERVALDRRKNMEVDFHCRLSIAVPKTFLEWDSMSWEDAA
jgi:hypothetical protein